MSLRRRLLASAVGVGLSLGLGPSEARAHGSSGTHESPQWCGGRIAVLTDAGLLLVDGASTRTIAVPESRALHAWSPACDRVVVASERVAIVDVAAGSVRDLGPVPTGFRRTIRLDGALPTIRFSPSGARFALPVAGQWRPDEGVYLYDVASGRATAMAIPRGEVQALGVLDDDTVVAAVVPGSMHRPARFFRANARGATPINATDYQYPRISISPVVLAAMTNSADVVTIDLATGAERTLANHAGYVRTMSWDGTRVLYAPDPAAESISVAVAPPGASTLAPRTLSLSQGIIADEHIGFLRDGTAGALGSMLNVMFDDGRRPASPRAVATLAIPRGARSARIEHVSLSPDGTQAAFVHAVDRDLPRGAPRRCDYNSNETDDLYVVNLTTRALRRVATIAHIEHCGIE